MTTVGTWSLHAWCLLLEGVFIVSTVSYHFVLVEDEKGGNAGVILNAKQTYLGTLVRTHFGLHMFFVCGVC
jgi:hypothetical protein